MTRSKRLNALADRDMQLRKEVSQVKNEIVKEIVQLMATHSIDIKNIRKQYQLYSEANRPKTGRHARRPIRYKDPDSGSTWTGLGVQPRWLQDKLSEGFGLENFRIEPELPGS